MVVCKFCRFSTVRLLIPLGCLNIFEFCHYLWGAATLALDATHTYIRVHMPLIHTYNINHLFIY